MSFTIRTHIAVLYVKHETLYGLKPSNVLNPETNHIRVRVFWMQAILSYPDQISQNMDFETQMQDGETTFHIQNLRK